jgi:hypothetical protein
LLKHDFSLKIFEKSPNIKCQENLCSENRVFPRGQADGQDRRTDMEFFLMRLNISSTQAVNTSLPHDILKEVTQK